MINAADLVDFETYYIVHDWYGKETVSLVYWQEDSQNFYTDSAIISLAKVSRAVPIPDLADLEQMRKIVCSIAEAGCLTDETYQAAHLLWEKLNDAGKRRIVD